MVMDIVARVYLAPFEWGVSDCCTRACDVFAELHGVDPMAPLRGKYSDRRGALRLVRAAGGWRPMCSNLAARAGLVPGVAVPGSLGLVAQPGRSVLAVRVPEGWALPLDGGLAVEPRALESWGVQ